jgi:hypothetical protein
MKLDFGQKFSVKFLPFDFGQIFIQKTADKRVSG